MNAGALWPVTSDLSGGDFAHRKSETDFRTERPMTNDGSVSLLVAIIPRFDLLIPISLHALAHSKTIVGSDVAGRVVG